MLAVVLLSVEGKPMKNLACGVIALSLFLMGTATARADDTAKDLIKKAIKAHGGAANLAKLKVRQEKTRTTFDAKGKTFTSTTDSFLLLPGRRKDTSEFEYGARKFTSILVVQGAKAWNHANGQTREPNAEQLRLQQERLHRDHVLTLTPLLE